MKDSGIKLAGVRQKLMTYKEFFNCQYPIIAAPMNRVSDTNLAIACFKAGIFPGLSVYSYAFESGFLNHELLGSEIKKFQDHTGSDKILISLSIDHFLTKAFYKLANELNLKYFELIGSDEPFTWMDPDRREVFSLHKKNNVKLIPKIVSQLYIQEKFIDAVVFKMNDGAGRSYDEIDSKQELKNIQSKFPNLPIIVSGGIANSNDIKYYLNNNCMAVAIGTLFAASEESCLSKETKIKMIEASFNDIKRLSKGAQQNALIFKEIDQDDDFNNTQSLLYGIKDPSKGHIFAGKGLDSIKSIRPVADIVQELVDGL